MWRYAFTIFVLIASFVVWGFYLWLEEERQVLDENRIYMASQEQKIQQLRDEDKKIQALYHQWMGTNLSQKQARVELLRFYDTLAKSFRIAVVDYIKKEQLFLVLRVKVKMPIARYRDFKALHPEKGFMRMIRFEQGLKELKLVVDYFIGFNEERI